MTGRTLPARQSVAVAMVLLAVLRPNGGTNNSLRNITIQSTDKILTQVLRLGEEGLETNDSEEKIFGFISSIAFDAVGDILVVDTKIRNLRKFSNTGRFIWEFSKEGRGPGEIMAATLVKAANDWIFVYDLGNRKIVRYDRSMVFQEEFIVPRALLGMNMSKEGDIYGSGVSFKPYSFERHHIIIMDSTGQLKKTFGGEIELDVSHVTKDRLKWLVYDYYAGWIGLSIWNDKLLASPIYDSHTFVYTLDGKFLSRFKNPDFRYKLLNYTVRERSVRYPLYETRAGTAIGLSDQYILKGYQVSKEEGHIQYYLDVFDAQGKVVKSQIPINGILMDVFQKGNLIVTTSFHPFPQLWVYRVELDQLENKR